MKKILLKNRIIISTLTHGPPLARYYSYYGVAEAQYKCRIHSVTHSATRSPIDSLYNSVTHALSCSLVHLLTRSLTHSLTGSLTLGPLHRLYFLKVNAIQPE